MRLKQKYRQTQTKADFTSSWRNRKNRTKCFVRSIDSQNLKISFCLHSNITNLELVKRYWSVTC